MADRDMSFGRINDALSREIIRIRRINYVNPDGSRDAVRGPIEFSFGSDFYLRLESASDGVSLRLRFGEWSDPFAEPLSEENRQFVLSSGKWTAYDVSDEDGYRDIVGRSFDSLDLITLNELIIGVEVSAGSAILKAVVDADELVVSVSVV
jgi:hypothetical protein